ncbi:phosphatase PAP2 family protein [Streptomyces sp. NPDC001480]|uniref:phosphatase PAP2 family protein n=1 Tax=Streptomyces sp. NPDC001480 TaxID=3364577 RepID=UPI0036C78CAA
MDDMDRDRDHGTDPEHRIDLDHRILSALHARGADPLVASAARGLSLAGEHAALWLTAGLAGAAVDGARRGAWLRGTVLVAGAHLASMAVKRIVRRARPAHVVPLVRTAGRYSFPSSHAASAGAAAVAFGTLGAYAVPPLAAAMCLSRLVLGVHHPSDVAAGAALGVLTARAGARWMRENARG